MTQASPPAVINDAVQLREFAGTPAFASNRPLILRIPGLTEPEALAAAERLNADRAECGCALGARAMTVAFVVALALLMHSYGAFTLALLARLPIAIAAGVAFAMVGKAVGIAQGRHRARREVARILATLPGPIVRT